MQEWTDISGYGNRVQMLPNVALKCDSARDRFSDSEIRSAIAHHRRAIAALRDRHSFEGIDPEMAEQIAYRLEQDLRTLQEELRRRRMGIASDLPTPQRPRTSNADAAAGN